MIKSKLKFSKFLHSKLTMVYIIFSILVWIITASGCEAYNKTHSTENIPLAQSKTLEINITKSLPSNQNPLESSPFGEILDFAKPNWYGIYPGISETQSIIKIKNIKGSNFKILKRDKSYEPDNVVDTIDKFYYVDEYIEIHINDGSYTLISISKGYVVLLNINIEKYTIDNCIQMLGKPEKVTAYLKRTGGIGYNFFNTSSGYVFSGEISQQQQKNQVKPSYPVTNIYIVSPENFHYIYESYLTGYIDENQRKTMMDDWVNFESITIRSY